MRLRGKEAELSDCGQWVEKGQSEFLLYVGPLNLSFDQPQSGTKLKQRHCGDGGCVGGMGVGWGGRLPSPRCQSLGRHDEYMAPY